MAAVRKCHEEIGNGTLRIYRGSPWQNGIVWTFSGRLLEELFSSEIFAALGESSVLAVRRQRLCNHRRIRRALGKLTSAALVKTWPALPALRLAAAPPGLEEVAFMQQFA